MRFEFSEEQRSFQSSVRDFLRAECTSAHVRATWQSDAGRIPALWRKLAELGVVGLAIPEAYGGLGMAELDAVLLHEEAGRAALPEPLVETTVGAGLLVDAASEELRARWLPKIASGEATIALGIDGAPFVVGAGAADLLLLARGGELHAVLPSTARLERQLSVDGSRKLFSVAWEPDASTRIAGGDVAATALATAFDRAALATASELVGLAAELVSVTAEYTKVRKQFGKPIGSFQAVKHHLVNAHSKVELARPVVYRAAHSMARGHGARSVHVSMAKAQASEAAMLAARTALQCHGAIGYTTEHELHLWMKRAWALAAAWGDAAFHTERVAVALLDGPEGIGGDP